MEQAMIMDLLSSSSDEDDDFLDEFFLNNCREPIPRISNYIEDVIHMYTNEQFQKHFRLQRTSCYALINLFEESPFCPGPNACGSPPKNAEEHILAFLSYAANKYTLRNVSELYNMSKSTLFEVNDRVMSFLLSVGPSIIRFPRTDEEKNDIAAEFERISGISGVVGSLDGTYINIQCPAKTIRSTYINRHESISITLQGICDAKLRFLDCFTGVSSKIHDSRIFKLSFIYPLVHQLGEEFHLVADGAYGISQNVITPYRRHIRLSRVQQQYNRQFSKSRVKIENCFGRLKGRFRHLLRCDFFTVEKMAKFILCCCILHNIAIENDNYLFDLDELNEICNYHVDNFQLNEDMDRDAGIRKRDEIAANLDRLL